LPQDEPVEHGRHRATAAAAVHDERGGAARSKGRQRGGRREVERGRVETLEKQLNPGKSEEGRKEDGDRKER
jgi:hypothetical protein